MYFLKISVLCLLGANKRISSDLIKHFSFTVAFLKVSNYVDHIPSKTKERKLTTYLRRYIAKEKINHVIKCNRTGITIRKI